MKLIVLSLFLWGCQSVVYAQNGGNVGSVLSDPPRSCKDTSRKCPRYVRQGRCNEDKVLTRCRKSCTLCNPEETSEAETLSDDESNSGVNERLTTWRSITSKAETESLTETTTFTAIVETVEEAETESENEAKGLLASETESPMVAKTENPMTPKSESQITTEKESDPATETPAVDENRNSDTSLKVCPGVCVATRISSFCEAALDIEGLCKSDLRCCVAADFFESIDNPPTGFVVLNLKETVTEEANPSGTTSRTISTKSTTTTTTTTTTPKSTTIAPKTELSTVYSQEPNDATTPDPSIPEELRCKGTCVAGFFAFLCDEIDRSGRCPRGGKCCVTQKRRRPTTPPPGLGGENEPDKPSRPPPPTPIRATRPPTTPSTTTSTTTPSPPPPPPPTPAYEIPLCPGICLPELMSQFCRHPSLIVEAPGCDDGTVCCDNRIDATPPPIPPSRSEPPHHAVHQVDPFPPRPTNRPFQPPPASLTSLFGQLLGGNSQRPPQRPLQRPPQRPPPPPPIRRTRPPPRPTTPTTTATTTTTTTTPAPTEAPDLRPTCPGTCINLILSFTCFGNAEITDVFKCDEDKVSCCAPKSAIRDQKRQEELFNIARNDTFYNPNAPFSGQPQNPGFQQPPYEQPPYSQPPYEQPPYSHSTYEQDYEQPIYEQPPYEQPPYDQPPYDQPPYYEHPINEQLPYEQPPYEQPPYEQPPYEQPPYEQPPYEQPPYEQPQPHEEVEQPVEQPQPPPFQPYTVETTVAPPTTRPTAPTRNKYVCGVKGIHRGKRDSFMEEIRQGSLSSHSSLTQEMIVGSQRQARVVGGEDATPGEWCWQVALINSLNQYLCGGALIGTQWVLTAAHCVTNIVRSGDAIYVRVGDHDLTTKFGSPGAQTLRVATTYIHHNHNSQTLDNDIALLKLSGHADLKEGVCLVCLPARGVNQVAGNRCTVTGYGYMGETGPIPLRVREAEVPVVSDNECVRKINAVTEKIFILPASSFCAGGESGHDACQGDGGGPLVCSVDGYYELSGLVSWGFGCGRQDVPGVYVKVSSFIGWINQIISVNNL